MLLKQGSPPASLQVPSPSHSSLLEQRGSTRPRKMSEQVPTDRNTLQAVQVALHEVLQQTPSTQCPLAQAAPLAHA
ncbi:hypothetical protein [Sorangium cellulosum]|uniref:hypothetical protein n=1 Tax=Sorangium cellulosum TaxID=56 RepID=UPI0010129FAF|nr:hypothetical protein [Sorangium cellulosum]